MTIQQRLITSSARNTEERFGLILMLDAFGVSSFNHLQQRQWLHNRDAMLQYLAEQQAWHLNNLKNDYNIAAEQIKSLGLSQDSLQVLDEMIMLYQEIHHNSDFSSFGDTIVFHSWCSDKYDSPEHSISLMSAIVLSLHEVMKANIKFNLKLRGALSLGRYYLSGDGNTILGSALISAYKFYEAADWIGILVAPGIAENHMNEAESIVKLACDKYGITDPKQFAMCNKLSYRERLAASLCALMQRHEVPLSKARGTQSFWVPSWPLSIYFDKITGSALNELSPEHQNIALECIQPLIDERNTVDPKYHPKYDNTTTFFRVC